MKTFRAILVLFAVASAAAIGAVHGAVAAFLVFFLLAALLGRQTASLRATLTASEILQDTLDAFKVQFPMLKAFTTDFSSERAVKDQSVIAHIATLPSVQDYDATDGFEANAAESSDLLTDVAVTMDRLKHVPVRIKYLTAIASQKDLYRKQIYNQAFVLGKSVVDYALSLVVAANFSEETIATIANTDKSTLDAVAKAMNARGCPPVGRFGIVNGDFYNALEGDSRIASGDYYGQRRSSNAYGALRNVAGFENIWEYPDLPAGVDNLSGFFAEPRSIVIASRLPDVQSSAEALGVPSIASFETVTDPDSGLSLLGICWQKQGTFDVWMTIALLYGAKAGSQGGGAGVKCDYAGHRVVTAA